MLCNESGKSRSTKDLKSRERKRWQISIISNGEITLQQKIIEGKLKPMAGQEIRMPCVMTDENHFSDLHGYPNSYALTKAIEEGIAANYGHAGRMFHEQVVSHYDEVETSIKANFKEEVDKLCSAYPGASNQISRVAERFALAIIAGKFACDWHVFPFSVDVVKKSVKACFDNWIANRGGVTAREDIEAIELVKSFIHAHRLSRFERLDTASGDEKLDNQPVMRDLVGYANIPAHEYYFYKDAFEKDVLKGLNAGKACKVLLSEGLLKRDDDPARNVVRKRFGGRSGQFYKIVLDDDPDDGTTFDSIGDDPELSYAF